MNLRLGIINYKIMKLRDLLGKKVHFIGIGGVSMSGIALYFASIGVNVQGSDSALEDSKYLQGCAAANIKLFKRQEGENITRDIDLIVRTSTVKDDNPEIIKAREFGIRIIERFDALEMIVAQFKTKIGVSGSSGKTTTTALIWQALCNQDEKPSCIIGTVLKEFSSSVFVNGRSDICVIEADESDGIFADMAFDVAVITDIDSDHLDHKRYNGSREKLIAHFETFAEKTLKNNGIVIYNINCKTTTSLMKKYLAQYKDKVFSYSGLELVSRNIATNECTGDIYLTGARNIVGGLQFSCGGRVSMENISVPMIGKINAFNALPGVLLAKLLLNFEGMNLLEKFQGAQKRCEIVGTVNNITVIDDYAHSPKKIAAFIQGFASYARDIDAKFVVVCEPHKYTRVASQYGNYITCFDNCDYLVMMPIFGVHGRDIDPNLSSEMLSLDIRKHWDILSNKSNKKKYIKNLKNNNEVLLKSTFRFGEESWNIDGAPFGGRVFYVFLGAGFSSKYAHLLYHSISMK